MSKRIVNSAPEEHIATAKFAQLLIGSKRAIRWRHSFSNFSYLGASDFTKRCRCSPQPSILRRGRFRVKGKGGRMRFGKMLNPAIFENRNSPRAFAFVHLP